MNDAQHLADRYVSVWIEADPDRRRQAIAEIWRPDGQHYVDVREARGYDALEQRIVGSYERNIRDGRHRFRSAPGALGLRDLVVVPWEMMVADSERKVASGVYATQLLPFYDAQAVSLFGAFESLVYDMTG
jgi:hypothetical protein